MNKEKLLQKCALFGIIAVAFYFAHVVVGNILYSGYNPVKQAISDLTASDAPSELAARILSSFYGIFSIAFALVFYLFFKKKMGKVFSVGALVFLIMNVVSAIGYAAFPLSGSGKEMNFQNLMHIVTTAIVVLTSIAALILLATGFIKSKRYKVFGVLAIVTLCLMAVGSILTGAVPAILGVAERINIYSLQIYVMILTVFMLKYKEQSNNK